MCHFVQLSKIVALIPPRENFQTLYLGFRNDVVYIVYHIVRIKKKKPLYFTY